MEGLPTPTPHTQKEKHKTAVDIGEAPFAAFRLVLLL